MKNLPKPKYCLFSRSFASLRMTKRRAQDDKKNVVMLNEVKHLPQTKVLLIQQILRFAQDDKKEGSG